MSPRIAVIRTPVDTPILTDACDRYLGYAPQADGLHWRCFGCGESGVIPYPPPGTHYANIVHEDWCPVIVARNAERARPSPRGQRS
jgi:hypothetical protein